jgi:hypothetical protein
VLVIKWRRSTATSPEGRRNDTLAARYDIFRIAPNRPCSKKASWMDSRAIKCHSVHEK